LEQVIYFLIAIIRSTVIVMNYLVIIRAIMSWFPGSADGALGSFVYTVTEPLVSFVGSIIYRVRFLRDIPIDLSLFFSCILLNILLLFL